MLATAFGPSETSTVHGQQGLLPEVKLTFGRCGTHKKDSLLWLAIGG